VLIVPLLTIVGAYAANTVQQNRDVRDPLPLPFPAASVKSDLLASWQDEIHWDRSDITLTDGSRHSRSPSDATTSFTAGYKPWDDFAFQLQAYFPSEAQGFFGYADYVIMNTAEAGFDFGVAGMLGWSRNGGLLSGGSLLFSRTFPSAPSGKGFSFTPRLGLTMRELGQIFSVVANENDPNTAAGQAHQKRLVFDTLILLEAKYKSLFARIGGGWENLVQTHYTHNETAGANFTYVAGPLLVVSLGFTVSLDDL
jgi:hypothetical protein